MNSPVFLEKEVKLFNEQLKYMFKEQKLNTKDLWVHIVNHKLLTWNVINKFFFYKVLKLHCFFYVFILDTY